MKTEEIQKQVDRWDLYAKIMPTVFLIVCMVLVSFGVIDFETAFWVGLGLFAVTAVTWWFWTIYTIRHLVHTLNRASKNLDEVRTEFTEVSKEVQAIRNEK